MGENILENGGNGKYDDTDVGLCQNCEDSEETYLGKAMVPAGRKSCKQRVVRYEKTFKRDEWGAGQG